jgi:hypothetical protein
MKRVLREADQHKENTLQDFEKLYGEIRALFLKAQYMFSDYFSTLPEDDTDAGLEGAETVKKTKEDKLIKSIIKKEVCRRENVKGDGILKEINESLNHEKEDKSSLLENITQLRKEVQFDRVCVNAKQINFFSRDVVIFIMQARNWFYDAKEDEKFYSPEERNRVFGLLNEYEKQAMSLNAILKILNNRARQWIAEGKRTKDNQTPVQVELIYRHEKEKHGRYKLNINSLSH